LLTIWSAGASAAAGPSMVPAEDSALDAVASSAAPPDRQTDFVRVLRNCSRVLEERVSDDQREAFSLRYIENRSTRDIAKEMEKTTQAIKISLFRARRTLSEHNKEAGLLLSA
jgi:DNA-directed RNA polymerase specialized sigma24 family protein